jgi:hypothetical protein
MINPEAAPIRQALPMSMRQIASGFPFLRLRRFTADRRMHGPLVLAETNAVTPRSVGRRDAHSMTSLEPGSAWILPGRRYERPLLRIALLMGLLWDPMVFPPFCPRCQSIASKMTLAPTTVNYAVLSYNSDI